MGIRVFPGFNENWFFEDKVAQKYLLESIDADIVKCWVFYNKNDALTFLKECNYPLVAKLRKGAGSHNVKLLKNYSEARQYTRKMFGKGINPSPGYFADFGNRSSILLKKRNSSLILKAIRSLPTKVIDAQKRKKRFHNEKGYVYFQEYLPGNTNDLRITVVRKRAWGFFRNVRKNDFRASGSGMIDYDTDIPLEVVRKSFDFAERIKARSIAFDYVKDREMNYRIVEICYGFVGDAVYNAKGYWDDRLIFHRGHYRPEECILEDFLGS